MNKGFKAPGRIVLSLLVLLGGCLIGADAQNKHGQVQCLEFFFEFDGKPLLAGRTPAYGTEEPMHDMQPPSGSAKRESKIEVYKLSPLPMKFLPFMEAENTSVFLHPPFPFHKGELRIRIGLTSSEDAFNEWLKFGFSKGSQRAEESTDLEVEREKWRKDLSGKRFETLQVVLQKKETIYADGGNQVILSNPETATLKDGGHIEFKLQLDPLREGRAEVFQLQFPGFKLGLERRMSYLDLSWPKGMPTISDDAKPPASNPAPKKGFFRKFF